MLKRRRGFTLIELLVVLAIVALLITIAVPRYFHSVDRSKEVVLRQNLLITRDSISKFYGDTGRYPENLDELVSAKYLKSVPRDPILESSSGWVIIPPDDSTHGNVADLRSGAPGSDLAGKPFSDY